MKKYLFLINFFSFLCLAENSEQLKLKHSVKIAFNIRNSKINEDYVFNKDNKYIKIPQNAQQFAVKPDFEITTTKLNFIIRPRFVLNYFQTKDIEELKTNKFYNAESYIDLQLNEKLKAILGTQNYQWGPSELLSFSNPFFYESFVGREANYEVIGHNLARLNYSFNRQHSLVLMSGYEKNKDAFSITKEEVFRPKHLIKYEFTSKFSEHYAGFVLFTKDKQDEAFGEYYSFDLDKFALPGLHLYGDHFHQKFSDGLYPNLGSSGIIEQVKEVDRRKLRHNLLNGLRYDFESGHSLRAESIYYEQGFKSQHYDLFDRINKQPNAVQFMQTQLILPGQRFIMGSLRLKDLYKKEDGLIIRMLLSQRDKSSWQSVYYETFIDDHTQLFCMISHSLAKQNQELEQSVKSYALLGSHYTF